MKIFTFLLFALIALPASAEEPRVKFPKDYREAFVEYLSLDRLQNPDQVIRLFANDIAMQGANEDNELPDGSVLVGEVYAAAKNSDGAVVKSALGRRIAGKLLLVAVMEKQDTWSATSTSSIDVGNWDFGAFKPDGVSAGKELNECRACHTPLKDTDHLFSIEHLPTLKQ